MEYRKHQAINIIGFIFLTFSLFILIERFYENDHMNLPQVHFLTIVLGLSLWTITTNLIAIINSKN